MNQSKKNNILIIGGNGFIGRSLIKKLKKKEIKFLNPTKKKLNLKNKKQIFSYLNKFKPKIIINLVSSTKFFKNKKKEDKNHYNNTFITALNLSNIVDRKYTDLIIFFGSIEEYGNSKIPKNENSKLNPSSIYGKYKKEACLKVTKILKKKDINYLWLRPSLVYGIGDNKNRYLGYIINQIKKNKKIIINPGNQIRDYLFIDDLVKIVILFIKNYKKKYNSIVNISSENFVYLREIPNMINKHTKYPVKFINLKKKMNLKKLQDNSKLKKMFPKFKFTSFSIGLKKTLSKENLIK